MSIDHTPIHVLSVGSDPHIGGRIRQAVGNDRRAFDVTTVASADKGLARLHEATVDCVVSGYDLPDTDGVAFLETVRADRPELPFVLFTDAGSEEIASEAISAGVTDYLRKGLGTAEYERLGNRIVDAIETRECSRERFRERRERQQALEAAEARFRSLTENTTLGVVTIDADSTVRYANDAVSDLFGYAPEALVGESLAAVIPDRLETGHFEALGRYLETGTKTLDWEWIELPARHRDGYEFPVGVSFGEYVDDGEHLLTGVIRDISDRKRRDRELEQYEAAIEAMDDAVYVLDEQGHFEFVNEAFTELTGYDPATVLGSGVGIIKGEKTVELFEEVLGGMLSSGTPETTVEFDIRTANDESIPCEDHLAPRIVDGEFRGVVGAIRDISERKKRERELERNKDLLERTQQVADVGGWELDLADDELRWTDEVYRIHELPLGYIPELENALEFYHPEDRPIVEDAIERAIEGGESFDIELRITATSDTTRWVRAQGEPHREHGETVLLRGAFQDITERKERERRIEMYVSMLNSVPDPVYALDTGARFTAINDATEAVTGYGRDEILGGDVSLLMNDTDIATGNDAIRDLIREDGHERATFEMELVTASGERIPYENHVSLFRSREAASRGTIGILRDITDRKRTERTLTALHEGARDLMAARTSEEVADIAVETAVDALDHPLVGVHYYDPDVDGLVPVAWSSRTEETVGQPPTFESGAGLAWEVFETGEPVVYTDSPDMAGVYNPETPIRSEMFLLLGDHGVFLVGSTDVDDFEESDLALAKVLAANVEAAIDRADREQALRERETQLARERDRFAALFNNVPDSAVTVDMRDGELTVTSANEEFEDVFGYDAETVVGESLNDLIVPPDRMDEATAIDRTATRGNQQTEEVRRRTADGELRDFLFRNVPIDNEGDEAFGIYTDITERREHEAYRRRLYEIGSDMELTVDQKVQRALELGCEYLDMDNGFLTRIEEGSQRIVEAHGPHEALRPGSECPLSEAYCRKTIEIDEPMTVQYAGNAGWANDPAYERFGFESYIGATLTIDGERYGTVCFADRSPRETDFSGLETAFIDLLVRGIASELQRLKHEQELERQNEQLEGFASMISHDLRNPLTVATGYLDVLDTDSEEHLERIRRAHDRMERIIEDVLALARQGKAIGETRSVSLADVADTAWENVKTTDARLLIGDDIETVEADRGRLEALFENLFRNAIEHGREDVTCRVGATAEGFSVEDDGPGIPADEREDVFEYGHTTAESGTGLGLSIVSTIANAHGWTVTLAGAEGGGARFEFTL